MSRHSNSRSAAVRWRSALLTLVLIGGLLAVLWLVYRDQLTPAVRVVVEPVVLLAQNADDTASPVERRRAAELLFQASGWVEPDPWEVNVAVLTDGFVEQVFVKEGEPVTNGQLVAELDAADAHLELRAALAEEQRAAASLEAAQDDWRRIDALELRDTTPRERIAAETQFDARKAEFDAAQARVAMARLALERTTVRSPMDGIVLKRFAHPGSKRRAAMDDPNSAAIVSLYDPQRLQVRVDVPLAEAGKLAVGQDTRIATALLPGIVHSGRVTRIVGQADLQRNTLQAKVEIHDPDPRLRPEVLCRVEFWSRASGGPDGAAARGSSDATTGRGLWIAEAALADPAATEQEVWVVDPIEQRAQRRAVRVGRAVRDGYRNVLDGLRANERVVVRGYEKLEEGRRVEFRARESNQ